MKKIKLYAILVCVLLFPFAGINAQVATPDYIKIENIQVEKQGDNVRIDLNINLDDLKMKSNQMIVLTPVLQSADKRYTKTFAPVALTGARRNRTLERQIDWEGFRFDEEPMLIQRRYNNKAQSIPLTLNVLYDEWIRGGELVFLDHQTGCAMKVISDNTYSVYKPVLPILIDPVYTLSYVTPPVEEVKQRSETHAAHLNFQVGKSVILPDFQNNAAILRDVDDVIREVHGDENLTITEFKVVGYASPEGNETSNMALSQDRARAFVNYVTGRYNIKQSTIKIDWKGEDWDGLRKIVQESMISNKNEILNVLDEPNNATRKNKLKQLNGGQTYRMLLDNYYPQLRRNEYTIAFVARPFSVDEAKEQIKTKPQYLSLNEMFLVANTYPTNSTQFKDVFDIAVRMYPENPIAQQNTAALEIENGSYDSAINRLLKVNMPEAYNNLGVAYAKKGEFQKALEYFDKAVNGGHQGAIENKSQLSTWLEMK